MYPPQTLCACREGLLYGLATEAGGENISGISDLSQEAKNSAIAALSAVHAAGVLHNDIRPENLVRACVEFGSMNKKLMLIDFACSKFVGTGASAHRQIEAEMLLLRRMLVSQT
jgi:serine/threonine protein kinase